MRRRSSGPHLRQIIIHVGEHCDVFQLSDNGTIIDRQRAVNRARAFHLWAVAYLKEKSEPQQLPQTDTSFHGRIVFPHLPPGPLGDRGNVVQSHMNDVEVWGPDN
jgi:hypothetical protein